ncbi:MAG: TetR/AcrR family transcriptional regulator [Deltaproteobacteria bacterium]|nr:TetR/AcrR family transcriptional regulator [Deltaproteobacteria bacterium]
MAPKVSEDYLEARREQILDAARTCFSRTGYHRTTVQDICKEAALSPGAVYRYFDSKESIFEGLAEWHLAAQSRAMGCIAGLDDLFTSVAAFANGMMAEAKESGAPRPGVMQVELAGEAMSNERIAATVRKMLTGVRSNLEGLVHTLQEKGKVDPTLDAQAVASVMMALFQGALFQSVIGIGFDPEAYLEVVRKLKLPAGAANPEEASS